MVNRNGKHQGVKRGECKRNRREERKSICMCNKDEKTKKNVTVGEKFARTVSRFSKNSSTFQLQNAPHF